MVHKPSDNNRKVVSLKRVYIDGVFYTHYRTNMPKNLLTGTQYKAIADTFELVTVFSSIYPVRWIKADDFAILAHESM